MSSYESTGPYESMSPYEKLTTEQISETYIDSLSTEEMVRYINREDRKVAEAVEAAVPAVAAFLDAALPRFSGEGRLFYVGAGTSGRLGVADAAECPPTFGVSCEKVQGIILGGPGAVFNAVEGAEDDPQAGVRELRQRNLTDRDIVVGLSASGSAAGIIGALDFAREKGALTGCICCNPEAALRGHADYAMLCPVGPEVVSGSTRMKAGTAQKMILNMISTGLMVKSGKVYKNRMINLRATNKKLTDRAIRIISDLLEVSRERAAELLAENEGDVGRVLRNAGAIR